MPSRILQPGLRSPLFPHGGRQRLAGRDARTQRRNVAALQRAGHRAIGDRRGEEHAHAVLFDRREQLRRAGFLEQQRRGAGVQREQQQPAQPERERERRAAAEQIRRRWAAARARRTCRKSPSRRGDKCIAAFGVPVVPDVNAMSATSSAAVSRLRTGPVSPPSRARAIRRLPPALKSTIRTPPNSPQARPSSSRRRASQSACLTCAFSITNRSSPAR